MAGIGFELRKLSQQDNLLGVVRAYGHSALASAGAWIFTVISLGIIMAFGNRMADPNTFYDFRLIIIYNFAFSLLITGSIYMIATRFLADAIYNKDVTHTPGLFLGTLMLLYAIEVPLAIYFYFFVANLSNAVSLSAIVNLLLVSAVWVLCVFLTALKDYRSVSNSFALGMVLAALAATYLASKFHVAGMINGFSAGLSFIIAILSSKIFAEYPYIFKKPFIFIHYFKKYWQIALSGILYNAAIWVDKWIMWFSPQADHPTSNLINYPYYDNAMFLAYLTILPSLGMFMFSVETNFYEHYLRFYRDIQERATFPKIQQNYRAIVSCIFGSSRNFLILQGTISIAAILLSPHIHEVLRLSFMQLGIFRYGVLGALFQVLTLFLTILLSYFDNRNAALFLNALFFVTNGLFTYMTIHLGFEFYGFGYFLATVVTFVASCYVIANFIAKLPYHTFITANTSL